MALSLLVAWLRLCRAGRGLAGEGRLPPLSSDTSVLGSCPAAAILAWSLPIWPPRPSRGKRCLPGARALDTDLPTDTSSRCFPSASGLLCQQLVVLVAPS